MHAANVPNLELLVLANNRIANLQVSFLSQSMMLTLLV
jgi:hypothetical protein